LDTQKGRNVNRIIIKDKNILFNDKTYEDLNELEDVYGNDFLIQEELKQHSLLSSIYSYSLNTIRIITYRDKSKSLIDCISAVIRFGNEKRIVDNRGVACGINAEGRLNSYATDLRLEKSYKH